MIIKRIFDFIASLLGLLVLLLVLVVIAILIKLLMPGPVFFIQTRISKGGKEFRLLKFRTMLIKPKTSEGSFDAGDQSKHCR